MDYKKIEEQMNQICDELFKIANMRQGDILVIGCSTSAVGGFEIGTASSEETAQTLMRVLLPKAKENGVFLAIQGCEHINRALVVERECMQRYSLTEVCVKPWLHAGGAMSVEAMQKFDDPVMVEDVKGMASAGIDIGGTLIGMHLRTVVVPIHSAYKELGGAHVVMARTRPKYIGGPRAQYPDIVKY